MAISQSDLIETRQIELPTLGGRSALLFKFNEQTIEVTNSQGRTTRFSWEELQAVHSYCNAMGYGRVGSSYNPMNGGSFPEDYPKHQDTLSLVALVHYMVGSHQYCT